VAQLEERRDDRELRRWLKRIRRGAAIRPLQWLGLLLVVIGLIVGGLAWAADFSVTALAIAVVVISGGVGGLPAWSFPLQTCRYRFPNLKP